MVTVTVSSEHMSAVKGFLFCLGDGGLPDTGSMETEGEAIHVPHFRQFVLFLSFYHTYQLPTLPFRLTAPSRVYAPTFISSSSKSE